MKKRMLSTLIFFALITAVFASCEDSNSNFKDTTTINPDVSNAETEPLFRLPDTDGEKLKINAISEDLSMLYQEYDCGNSCRLYRRENVASVDREDFISKLMSEGYAEVASNSIGENKFNTFMKNDEGYHICYYPSKTLFNVITVKKSTIGSPSGEKVKTPSLTQLELDGNDSGMSAVIQLSDGRFIMVDGGLQCDNDEKRLFDYLNQNKPDSHAKPVIAAWFMTHAHPDHIQLANDFLKKYGKDVELQAVYANFPDFGTLAKQKKEFADMERLVDIWNSLTFKVSQRYKYHTGEKFMIGDAEIEILFTQEERFPQSFDNGNNTSSAFRVKLGGKTINFLGDCLDSANKFMAKVYGDELKCDILQVPHHGYSGGTQEIYECCSPEICLWSVGEDNPYPDRYLGNTPECSYNKWLWNNCKAHYYNSYDTIIPLM